MADIQGVTGSSVRASRASSTVGTMSAVDGQGGRGGGADGPQAIRSHGADVQAPQIIRFEGMVLDPNAPRGTYLDILV